MPNVLEVQIVGDVSGLEKSLKQAEKLQAEYTASIKSTSDEIDLLNRKKISDKKIGVDVSATNKQISILQDKLIDLRGDLTKAGFAAEKTTKSISGIQKPLEDVGGSADTAVDSVSELTYPLLEASGATEEMSAGADVLTSALSGGLAGAITAVVGYLVNMYIESKKAAMAMSEVAAEASKSAQSEISSINAYVAAAKNRNLSDTDRLIAVKKLQSEYPAYFGNLTQEQILNGNVATAVQQVTAALIAKAKAAGFSEKIADLAKEEFLLRQKEKKGIDDLKNAYKSYANQKGKASAIGGVSGGGGVGGQLVISSEQRSLKEIQDQIRSNASQQKLYTEEINKSTAAQIGLEKEVAKTTKTSKEVKADVTPRISVLPLFEISKSTDKENDALLKALRDSLSEDITKLKVEGVEVNIPLRFIEENEFTSYIKKLQAAREETKVFSDAVGSSVGALANQLTSSFETGNAVLDAFVGSLIGSLAQIAQAQIASLIAEQTIATAKVGLNQAVSTSNAVTAATSTAAASGPAAAFLLPALVGAAIGFVAASFAGIKFAHGGVVPGGSYTGDKIPAMLNSGEAVLNNQQQANVLMSIANGNSNSLQSNRVIDNFEITSVLRGADILLSVERQKRKR